LFVLSLKRKRREKGVINRAFFKVVISNLRLANQWDLDVPGDSEWHLPGKTLD
jgi:hypothetical protein